MSPKLVNQIFLLFVGVIPILPRPTAEGPERFVLPLVLASVIMTWVLFWPKSMPKGRFGLPLLSSVLLFSLAVFISRFCIYQSYDETLMLVSRVLFAVGTVVLTHWFATTDLEIRHIMRYFLFGFLLSACLAIFVSLTGFQILEPDSVKPGRYLGIHKTTGVFRSFGEFGIMGSFAWVYLLVYRRDYQILTWLVMCGLVLMALLISQSRNVYLVVVVTTVCFLIFHYFEISAFARVAIAASVFLAPVIVELSMPALQQTSIGKTLVGEKNSVFERNVTVRFDQFSEARQFVVQDPVGGLIGYPRESWRRLMTMKHGDSVAPHNYFLSTILFVGFVGGFAWIFGLFVVPLVQGLQQSHVGNDDRLLVNLMMLGTIVGLSFYEGFFSLAVMTAISASWCSAFNRDSVAADESSCSVPTGSAGTVSLGRPKALVAK